MKNSILLSLAFLVSFISCKKETSGTTVDPASTTITSFEELQVPNNFKFETTQKVQLDLSFSSAGSVNDFLVKVYDALPTAGGNLLYSGFSLNQTLNTEIVVPAELKNLYVVRVEPNGSSTLQVGSILSGSFTHLFGKRKIDSKAANPSPDCSVGCDVSFNNHSGNITINSNDQGGVYCFSGTFNGQINVNKSGVTIRICGNATVTNLNLNNGSSLEVTDGASLTVNNLNLNSSSGTIVFHNCIVDITNNFSPTGMLTNNGTLNLAKAFNINGQGGVLNNGTISVTNNLNNNSDLTNNNSIIVGKDLKLNGGSTTINNCSIKVGDDLDVNNGLTNSGLIEITDKLTINGGGATTMIDGAMINAASAVLNSSITGTGLTSLVKVAGSTVINGGGSLNGNLNYCDADGVETNNGSINAPATLGCSVFIATSACNSLGNGTPTVTDTDQDGIADNNDLFPTDPDRAAETFYPGSSQYGTIAFEDLWPGLGDYDFNDLVVDYRFRLITNAANDVKDIEFSYSLRAIGGSLSNGFGFQLNVPSSAVQSVTGTKVFRNTLTFNSNGTESGQSKAVVIVFDDAFGELLSQGTATVNTIKGEAISVVDTGNMIITFTNAQSVASLGVFPYNPFIYVGQERGKEIHLAGQVPTDLMNASYFGTAEDDSRVNEGRFFVDENNLPWALNLSQAFQYPSEKSDIVETYNLFANWAQSGGTSSIDWYADLAGYRNTNLVY